MVLEPILVLVCLFTSNHGTLERLVLLILHHIEMARRVVDVHAVAVTVILVRLLRLLRVGQTRRYALALGSRDLMMVEGRVGQNRALVDCFLLQIKDSCRKMHVSLSYSMGSALHMVVEKHVVGQHRLHDVVHIIDVVSGPEQV